MPSVVRSRVVSMSAEQSVGERELVRVVVVDDAEDIRHLLRVTLNHDGRFDVVGEAADGLEAITVVSTTQPDLVILDRQMPRLGGLEALPEIRAVAPHAHVVLYTARPDADTQQAALAAGALDVLEKSGAGFVNKLAGVLLEHWASPDAAVTVRVGPVDSTSALVWINNARSILYAVESQPGRLSTPLSPHVADALHGFLNTWSDIAKANRTFVWVARATPAVVTPLVEGWAAINALTDDDIAALGCRWSPPAGEAFSTALFNGVLDALRAHTATKRLVAVLDPDG